MATQCHSRSGFGFQRKLTVDFNGGAISTEAGLLVLREFNERLGLTARLTGVVCDAREKRRTPEVRDFPAWRREHLEWFGASEAREEAWPLPG